MACGILTPPPPSPKVLQAGASAPSRLLLPGVDFYPNLLGNTLGSSAATSLLSFIRTLGPGGGGYLSGNTLNIYSSTPWDALNATTPTIAGVLATGVLPLPSGPATHLLPAIINVFAASVGSISGITRYGGGGSNMEINAAPNDWLSLAQNAAANGMIPLIDWVPNNPAGNGNNPWTIVSGGQPAVLTPGNAVYNTYVGWINNLATALKTITTPFLLAPAGELNLGGGLTNANWQGMNAGGSGIPSSAQVVATNQLLVNTLIAAGVKNFLFIFETNFGVGNEGFGYTSAAAAFTDILAYDTDYHDSTGYANLAALGSQPIFCGSQSTGPANQAGSAGQNTLNTASTANNFMSWYPRSFGSVPWCQQYSLNEQNGAVQFMSAPWIDKAHLPAFTSAGGAAGG